MIDLADYWMGRDLRYPLDMTPQIQRNALLTVELATKLLALAAVAGVPTPEKPGSPYGCCASGWRPPTVNANTAGASVTSLHMTGQAIDLYDPPDDGGCGGPLDRWLMSSDGQRAMTDLGLWHEHPDDTMNGWAHVQTIPPGSGRRTFRSGVAHHA